VYEALSASRNVNHTGEAIMAKRTPAAAVPISRPSRSWKGRAFQRRTHSPEKLSERRRM